MADLLKLGAKLNKNVKNKVATKLGVFPFEVIPPGFTKPVKPNLEVHEADIAEKRYRFDLRAVLDRAGFKQDVAIYRVLVPKLKDYHFGDLPDGTWLIKRPEWSDWARCAVFHQSLDEVDNGYGSSEQEIWLVVLRDEPDNFFGTM